MSGRQVVVRQYPLMAVSVSWRLGQSADLALASMVDRRSAYDALQEGPGSAIARRLQSTGSGNTYPYRKLDRERLRWAQQ